ncbi:hypothetical protein ACP49_16320 [Clostridium botulinum]|uniref:phage replisome organizer N-terminal domain-containing protein n=1 Tax=Clostridium botulinum TaxID=1491 RepID=UPI0006C4907B|nr:phage replisome organizer N-terminal domain-containing protein [Clostridium botulinum]KOM97097.1 hypothetical protein ACP53_11495 [Clostridium botulinum]KOM99514.1 hypothetical protein ACP49_16320 [Clostridium botulinum]MBY7004527.1 phage replisome organizer N-terminal domain-containing protein [Clostridium botulinum]MCR1147192.1 phage replisome organizer N-terminal domain-containing protein [Clostridium botulinum]NFH94533.1 hypothetical protein [Clostridium botulinum]
MSDNKKYYYLRIKENFYDTEDIKILQSMDNGYLYSDILMKLYLKSLKNEGRLMFKEHIPYNPKMVATVTGHNIAIVEKAIKVFIELGLIEILDNGAIYMLDIQNFIGKSSSEGDRKRAYRKKIEAEKQNLLPKGQMSDERPPEIEKEIDIELEKELEKEIDKDNIRINWKDILTTWNSLPKPIKPIRSVTKQRKDKIKARINSLKLKEEDVLKAIGNIKNSRFCQGQNDRNWIIEFDWLFQDDTRFTKVFENKYVDKEGKNGYTENNTGNKEQYDFSNY